MNFEVLKRSHLKRNILVAVLIIVLLLGIVIIKNRTNTLSNSSINKESITKELKDNLIGAYIQEGEEYKQTDDIPSSGYEFNKEKSYCKIGDAIQEDIILFYDMDTQTITVNPITKKGLKCYLYFDEKAAAGETILANYDTILTRTYFSLMITNTTTGTIYKSANESQYDDFGEVYYFAGNPTDNWFQFGTNSSNQPLYWRIVRINGDGSIRLIYNGTSTSQTGNDTMVNSNQAFNSLNSNNAYVGYMYGSYNATTYEETHANINDSTMKQFLDEWYLDNLAEEADYIDGNVGFCGDRTSYTNPSGTITGGGTGTTTTYYGVYIRLKSEKNPSFKCSNKDNDLYTTSGSSEGNKALSNPIGLISADEVAFAGGVVSDSNKNSSYYLYNGSTYWTMSPFFCGSRPYGTIVAYDGFLTNSELLLAYGVRPVINLKANVTILSGDGSSLNPYKITE